jgi:hypothetical protein
MVCHYRLCNYGQPSGKLTVYAEKRVNKWQLISWNWMSRWMWSQLKGQQQWEPKFYAKPNAKNII